MFIARSAYLPQRRVRVINETYVGAVTMAFGGRNLSSALSPTTGMGKGAATVMDVGVIGRE